MPRHFLPRTVLAAGLAGLTAAALAAAPQPAVALAAGQSPDGPAAGAAASAAPARPIPATSPAAPARPASSASSTAPAAPARPVLLINGDRLSVRALPGGGLAAALLSGAPAGGLLSLRVAGAAYEFPADALPYLGRGLDPSLFRLSAAGADRARWPPAGAGRLRRAQATAARRDDHPLRPGHRGRVPDRRLGQGLRRGAGPAVPRGPRQGQLRQPTACSAGSASGLPGPRPRPRRRSGPGFQMRTLTVAAHRPGPAARIPATWSWSSTPTTRLSSTTRSRA